MVRGIKKKNGATIIELIMTLLILGIISATVVGVIIFFTQLFMYSPRQLDTQKIAQELTNMMIEGNQDIRGLRYARTIIDASTIQFSYTYGYPAPSDQLSVRFRWNAADKHIYRSTSTDAGAAWSTETVIPYYLLNNSSLTIDGRDTSGVIFTYKKAADADWVSGTDPLTAIRRVIIGINLKTGSGASAGAFTGMQGFSNFTASAEIKKFQ